MKKNKISGFNLVEVMVCLAIIGLLASIMVGTYVRAKKDEKTKRENNVVETSGGTYIQFNPIRPVSESANFTSTIGEVRLYEDKHPDLKITGRQIIVDGAWIRGVVLWHEPRRDDPGR